MTMNDLSLVLGGVAAVITALGVLIGVVRRQGNQVRAQIGRVAHEVSQVNRAVNHQPPFEPTLIQRINRLDDLTRWQNEAIQTIADRIGVDVPPPPGG